MISFFATITAAALAATISLTSLVSGDVSIGSAPIYKKLIVPSAAVVQVQLTDLDKNIDLAIVDGNNTVVAQSNNTGTLMERISQQLSPGTYYLRLTPGSGVTSASGKLLVRGNQQNNEGWFRNTGNGQNMKVAANPTGLASQTNLDINTFTDFEIVANGDFNGDGIADQVWRSKTSGDVKIFLVNSSGYATAIKDVIGPVNVNQWNLRAAGDMNGDGKADLIWKNIESTGTDAGKVRIWTIDGTLASGSVITGSTDLSQTLPGNSYVVEAVGDFDQDGMNDLVVRHNSTANTIYVWKMNGTSLVDTMFSISQGDQSWKIEGSGDFNNDGKADLMWRQSSTGNMATWIMNGPTVASSNTYTGPIPQPWSMAFGGHTFNSANASPDLVGNSTATSTTIGSLISGTGTVTGNIGPGDTDDYYRLTTNAPTTFGVSITGTGTLTLLNDQGTVIATGPSIANQNLAANKTFYVRVNSTATTQSTYSLAVTATPGTTTATTLYSYSPGIESAKISNVLRVNNNNFFLSEAGDSQGLWKTDGTANGTVKVLSFIPGGSDLVQVGNFLYFSVFGDTGVELYRIDHTAATPTLQLVKEIGTGSTNLESSFPNNLKVIGTKVYFAATNASGQQKLWSTDGTSAGTLEVVNSLSNPSEIVAVGGDVYYVGEGSTGTELGRIPSGSNTSSLIELYPGTTVVNGVTTQNSASPSELTPVGTSGLVMAVNSELGREISKVVGSTVTLTDGYTGLTNGVQNELNPSNFAVIGTDVYFAGNGSNGRELRKFTFTGNTVSLQHEFNTTGDGNPEEVTAINGSLYMGACNPTNGGCEPYKLTPGSAPVRLADIKSGGDSNPGFFKQVGSNVFFIANGSGGYELYRESGTTAVLDTEINPGSTGSVPYFFTEVGTAGSGNMVMSAYTDTTGRQLFYRPAVGGVSLLKQVSNIPGDPPQFYNGYLYDSAPQDLVSAQFRPNTGTELYNNDGTLRLDINPGIEGSDPKDFISINFVGDYIFTAFDGTDKGIWRTNNTTKVTTKVTSGIDNVKILGFMDAFDPNYQNPNLTLSNSQMPLFARKKSTNSSVFFGGLDSQNRYCLYKMSVSTTGVIGSPEIVKIINTTGDPITDYINTKFSPNNFTWKININAIYDGYLTSSYFIFSANDGINGYELWSSDGTTTGTKMIKDINPGPEGSNPYGFSNWFSNYFKQGVYTSNNVSSDIGEYEIKRYSFMAYTPSTGYELYSTDGTDGTQGTSWIPNAPICDATCQQQITVTTSKSVLQSQGTNKVTILDNPGSEGINSLGALKSSGIDNSFGLPNENFFIGAYTGSNEAFEPVVIKRRININQQPTVDSYELSRLDINTSTGKGSGPLNVSTYIAELSNEKSNFYINQEIIDNTRYFTADDGTGTELWKLTPDSHYSDTSVNPGRVKITNINPHATQGSDPADFVQNFFSAYDGTNRKIYKLSSDGLSASFFYDPNNATKTFVKMTQGIGNKALIIVYNSTTKQYEVQELNLE